MLIGYAITDAVCCLTISLSLAYIFSHVVAHFSLSIFTKLFTKSVRICALTANRCTTISQYWEGLCADVDVCMFQAFLLFISFSPFVPYSQDIVSACVYIRKLNFFAVLCFQSSTPYSQRVWRI